MAFKKHVRLARLEGGALGMGGAVTLAPDIVALLWIQSRMVFYIAAAYGYDPRHPMRPAEYLALQGLYDTPAEAREALDGVGKRMAQAMAERALSSRRSDALHLKLAKYLMRRLARRYAGKLIPFIGAPIGAIQNGERHEAARAARPAVLRAAVDGNRGAARDGRVVRDEEAHHPRDLRGLDPLRVVGVGLAARGWPGVSITLGRIAFARMPFVR